MTASTVTEPGTEPAGTEPAVSEADLSEADLSEPMATEPAGGAPEPRRPRWFRRRWLRWVVALVVVAVLVLTSTALVAGTVSGQTGDDPTSVTSTGSAALAQLLRDQGVELTRTDDVDQAVRDLSGDQTLNRGATLVVAHPERLSADRLRSLSAARPHQLVLLRPDLATLTRLGVPLAASGTAGSGSTQPVTAGRVLSPGCTDSTASRAGTIVTPPDSVSYPMLDGATICYPDLAGGALVERLQVGGQSIVVIGTGLTNGALDQQGNAALDLGLLGEQPHLVWLMARSESTAPQPRSLLPPWWTMFVVQIGIGLVAVGIWRGRRLGPIISEQLPVSVRASETVEGHGRLYHRLSARDRAAEALRDGVRRRLGPRFGQTGPTGDPAALGQQLAIRSGRDPVQVQRWLNGPPPETDDQLVQLAHDLDRLEQEARQL